MINEQEGESSCRQTWKEQRRRSFKIGVASRAGFEGWLGQRAGINECFDSFPLPLSSYTKTHSTNHRRNTYTVTRKYRAGPALRKLPSLSRMAVGSFPWNLYGGWRRTVPTVRLEGRGNPPPSTSFLDRKFSFLRILSRTI